LLLCFAWRCCRIGDIKFFVKDIIKYIPGVGWGMHFLDCIYVKRNWTQDKAGIQKLFGKFKREQIPIFLVSFLEGTRVRPKKLKQAQEFAASRGMYVPQHTLVPRTKGFVASMQGLGDHLDAVYDMTIGYPDGVPRLVDCYLHTVKRIEVNITRYPMAQFADMDEAQLNTWVFDRYEEKDQRLAAFAAKGSFDGERSFGPIHYKEWLRGLH
jgi:1-acyl-sn-glycerol-3-phosphate acyltransferase